MSRASRHVPRSYWVLTATIALSLALTAFPPGSINSSSWGLVLVGAVAAAGLIGVARGVALAWWLLLLYAMSELLVLPFSLAARVPVYYTSAWILATVVGFAALLSPSLRTRCPPSGVWRFLTRRPRAAPGR